MRFANKFRSIHVGHPDLDRPQALLAQAFAMTPYTVTSSRHISTLHVTQGQCYGSDFDRFESQFRSVVNSESRHAADSASLILSDFRNESVK